MELAELARAHEDTLLALMLDEFELDSQRSRDWTGALVRYAVAQRAANAALIKEWVDHWKPLAYRGIDGIVKLFGQAPHRVEPEAVAENVRVAHDAFLAGCGLGAIT